MEKCFSYYKKLFQVKKEMQIISHLILQVYGGYSNIIPSLFDKNKQKKTDIQKGLRILQVNYRIKIYTQVQIPGFHYSTTIIGDILIDNP